MRKLIYISLLTLAGTLTGCETMLTPQPPTGVTSSNLADYFWHDSTYHYNGSIGSQTLLVQAGGTINDQYSGGNSTLAFTLSNGAYSLSGFSPSDIFGLEATLQVVADTTLPGPQTETIRSIAAINPKFGFNNGTLFAASDSVLYQVNIGSNTLTRKSVLPASGLTLAEDVTGNGIYAFQKGGNKIFFWSSLSAHWSPAYVTSSSGISAFASADPSNDHNDGDQFWVACGSQIYRFSNTSNVGNSIASPLKNVVALEAQQDGVLAAGDNNLLFKIDLSGDATPVGAGPGTINGIAGNYVSTSAGIFDYTHTGPAITSPGDSAIYATAFSVFGARGDGSVDHFGRFGPPNPFVITAPSPKYIPVTQFAFPNQGVFDPNSGVYALAGTQVFYRQDSITWVPVDQSISTAPTYRSGSLTLLDSNSSWNAGFVERLPGGPQHGYSYLASSSGPQPTVQVNGTTYNNVIIVNFTAKANNSVTDTSDIPQYNIYFEKGVGPAVIEKIENGKTTWTSLVK
jgi:hypothetical protein